MSGADAGAFWGGSLAHRRGAWIVCRVRSCCPACRRRTPLHQGRPHRSSARKPGAHQPAMARGRAYGLIPTRRIPERNRNATSRARGCLQLSARTSRAASAYRRPRQANHPLRPSPAPTQDWPHV
ncbi:hypothetical protein AK829_03930 [Corynebacterium riegelii]|uniref:Uncharacterized protein n=1 Tax=Corynebacterium riegelii TaxID=156976 RepID=A0A0K1RB72_9CORY|nr:hypothetical protein AK829_03930 [Corynebacterium riegelii]